MDKQILNPYNATQVHDGKKWATDARNNTEECHRHYAKIKQPDLRIHFYKATDTQLWKGNTNLYQPKEYWLPGVVLLGETEWQEKNRTGSEDENCL